VLVEYELVADDELEYVREEVEWIDDDDEDDNMSDEEVYEVDKDMDIGAQQQTLAAQLSSENIE
jgi:hypothetical protein